MSKRLLAAVLISASLLAGPTLSAQFRPGGAMRIVLLVDSSTIVRSMVTEFRAGLSAFLAALPGQPEVVIVSTGGQFRVRAGPTSDRVVLHAAANSFASDGGGNALLDTMIEADKRFLKNATDQKAIIVILTVDQDTSVVDPRIDRFNAFVSDFLARGGRAHAVVVTGVRTGVTTRSAENLVRNTDGFYDTVAIANAVPKLMTTVAAYVGADQ